MIEWIQYCWALFIVALYVLYEYVRGLLGRQRIPALESRYIFITGCDTGFGHLAAKRFDALGCHVIAGCLTERGEEELRKACSSRLKTVHLDVASHDSVAKAAEVVKSTLPANTGLYGILNNAGVFCSLLPTELTPLKSFVDVFAVNTLGQVDVVKCLLPLMRRSSTGRGRIVNVSSAVGRNAAGVVAPYAISKYGVEAFSDSIRRELHQFGISVHIIEPGGHATTIAATSALPPTRKAWDESPADVRSCYGGDDYINKKMAKLTTLLDGAPNPNGVVDAMQHALFSRYPQPRYPVGLDSHMLIYVNLLPEWLGDWMVRKIGWT